MLHCFQALGIWAGVGRVELERGVRNQVMKSLTGHAKESGFYSVHSGSS